MDNSLETTLTEPLEVAQPTISTLECTVLEGRVIEKIRSIYDPEIPVNIYDLGLIYNVEVTHHAVVNIKMTLTSPGCPVATTLPPDVQYKVGSIAGVYECNVDVIWDPPWNMDMMTEEAKLELGFF